MYGNPGGKNCARTARTGQVRLQRQRQELHAVGLESLTVRRIYLGVKDLFANERIADNLDGAPFLGIHGLIFVCDP
jgi:hypothetical protein